MEPAAESRLDAILPPGQALGVTEALARAEGEAECCATSGDLRWSIEGPDWRAGLGPAPRRALEVFASAGVIGRELAAPGTLALSVFTHLPPNSQEAFRAQVATLYALAPDAVAVYDANAQTMLSPAVVRDIAEVPVPPPPSRLYSVHVTVKDELAWMHTHGLRRCGTVEVELLDVPCDRVGDMRALLDAAAARLIEEGAPPSKCVAFEVSRETAVTWIPWQRAVSKLRLHGPGAERDEGHTDQTGVLMARPSRWRTCLPHRAIEGRPRVLVSRAETERMGAGARARWQRLVALHDAHATQEGWSFLIKVAFDAQGPCGREHLWVALEEPRGDGWRGRVLSRACRASIEPGDEVEGDLARVTGFQVRCPQGDFGPDQLVELETSAPE